MPEREKVEETASSGDHAGSQKGAHNPAREPVQRRVYLSMRLEEIGVDIAEKAKERERLTADLQNPSRKDGTGHKQLRQRRAYLAERLAMLRKEQADLHAERKAIGIVGGEIPGTHTRNPSQRNTLVRPGTGRSTITSSDRWGGVDGRPAIDQATI